MNRRLNTASILALLALVLPNLGCGTLGEADASSEAPEGTAVAKRTNLKMTVGAGGKIFAEKAQKIAHTVRGPQLVLTYVAEEGAEVEEGEVVARFDDSDLQEKLQRAEADRENARTAFEIAQQALEITEQECAEGLRQVNVELTNARLERDKLIKGELPKRQKSLRFDIERATSDLSRARESYDSLNDPELIKHGFVTRSQIEEERLAVRSAEIKLEMAEAELALFRNFSSVVQRRQAESAVQAAEWNLGKTKSTNASRLRQKQAEVQQKGEQLRRVNERITELETRIAGTVLKAPVGGVVIYGDTDEKRWWRQPTVRVGATFRFNQIFMTIPESSRLSVGVEVPEADITRIRPGLPAIVTSDAYPDLRVEGEVTKVGSVPISGHRSNIGGKKFDVTVGLPRDVDWLKSGVSARAEIKVAELTDVLTIPVSAVFVRNGHTFVFITDSDRDVRVKEVELGDHNKLRVQVLKGLEPGQRILLYQPEDMTLPDLPPVRKQPRHPQQTRPQASARR